MVQQIQTWMVGEKEFAWSQNIQCRQVGEKWRLVSDLIGFAQTPSRVFLEIIFVFQYTKRNEVVGDCET